MAITEARPLTAPPDADMYPYSDGKIMAETGLHVDAILYALATLRNWFASHVRVQVGANMFVYYQEGDASKRLTPDLFVVRGLEALPEPSFKIWEAGRPPTFVLEVASPSTEKRDRDEKQALYASMGVEEYWRFAPKGFLQDLERERVRLVGGVLQGLGYAPLESAPDGSIRSEVLGLDIRADEQPETRHLLRFRDPETGQDLLTFGELQEARIEEAAGRREAETKLRQEAASRREAEGKLRQEAASRREAEGKLRQEAASRREAERLQREAENRLREEAASRGKAERAQREAERAERAATTAKRDAEVEVARLRAQVARLKRG